MAYAGKILRVDLSSGRTRSEPLPDSWARDYLGGKGLAIKYLYEELAPGTGPLSPANKLVLMTGPLSGTIVPCSGKLVVATRSPATGTILDSSIGGGFAAELKYAGFDAVIIEGKAKVPVWLCIEDGRATLRGAAELWGKGAFESELLVQEKLDGARVLVIGPAGENLVPMACICSEFYRQAGRGGAGAVMGSKNLKAVAVRGSGSVAVPEIRKFMAALNKIRREDTLGEDNSWANSDGTPVIVEMSQTTGTLPTFNFRQGTFDGWENLNSAALQKVRAGKKGCFSCPLACGNFVRLGQASVEGPEYETLALCGANCGIANLEAVIEFNRLCDDFGLDTISAGNTIAFAMELADRGIHDFGLRFGETAGYLEAPALIARREGIGTELARGVRFLAEKYGGKEYAMETKNLEFPGYEPRGSWSMGLAYATADRGACHLRAWPISVEAFGDLDPYTVEGKAALVKEMQDDNSAKFSAIFCDFWAVSDAVQAEILSLVLGRSVTIEELKKIGERINNLARLFNQREGFAAKDDTLPARIFTEKLPSGPSAGRLLPRGEFDKMLAEYYSLCGWDEAGRVTEVKIKELGL